MSLVPVDLTEKFEQSGWHRGRRVAVDSRVPVGHPAHLILAEFGGLKLMRFYGDYEVCEVDFRHLPEKDDRTLCWEAALGAELVGIAEHHNVHGELLISSTGHVFGNSIVHPAFWLEGSSFQEAMGNLMAGHPDRPMLLDTDTSVMLFDREYTQDDPEVLHPSSPELR
jgi:hypothetical protein